MARMSIARGLAGACRPRMNGNTRRRMMEHKPWRRFIPGAMKRQRLSMQIMRLLLPRRLAHIHQRVIRRWACRIWRGTSGNGRVLDIIHPIPGTKYTRVVPGTTAPRSSPSPTATTGMTAGSTTSGSAVSRPVGRLLSSDFCFLNSVRVLCQGV